MSYTNFTPPVKGILEPDGTIRLEEPLALPSGPIEVQIRQREQHAQSPEVRDWWRVLQEIQANQQKRGFVGNVTDVDRDDEGYEERMKAIYANTVQPPESN